VLGAVFLLGEFSLFTVCLVFFVFNAVLAFEFSQQVASLVSLV